jgi:hypothetical protein
MSSRPPMANDCGFQLIGCGTRGAWPSFADTGPSGSALARAFGLVESAIDGEISAPRPFKYRVKPAAPVALRRIKSRRVKRFILHPPHADLPPPVHANRTRRSTRHVTKRTSTLFIITDWPRRSVSGVCDLSKDTPLARHCRGYCPRLRGVLQAGGVEVPSLLSPFGKSQVHKNRDLRQPGKGVRYLFPRSPRSEVGRTVTSGKHEVARYLVGRRHHPIDLKVSMFGARMMKGSPLLSRSHLVQGFQR